MFPLSSLPPSLQEHAKDVKGLDIGKYVAAAVIVFDLRTRTQKWMQHLDLSTDETAFKVRTPRSV